MRTWFNASVIAGDLRSNIIPVHLAFCARIGKFSDMVHHTNLLNSLAHSQKYFSYLELGLGDGRNFAAVDCIWKVGVDPFARACIRLPSDEFFKRNQQRFDLIFVDGNHEAAQVMRDVLNSLNFLNPGGTIMCHDMNPPTFEAQVVPPTVDIWTGDCWRAWVKLRQTRSDLEMFVVDTDFGCGIIRPGRQNLLEHVPNPTYNDLAANRSRWLNLVSVQEFYDWLNGATPLPSKEIGQSRFLPDWKLEDR